MLASFFSPLGYSKPHNFGDRLCNDEPRTVLAPNADPQNFVICDIE